MIKRTFARICSTFKKIWNSVTVEPVMFLIMFSSTLDAIALNQLKIDKACKIDFDFVDFTCDHLVEDNFTDENTIVQNEVQIG